MGGARESTPYSVYSARKKLARRNAFQIIPDREDWECQDLCTIWNRGDSCGLFSG